MLRFEEQNLKTVIIILVGAFFLGALLGFYSLFLDIDDKTNVSAEGDNTVELTSFLVEEAMRYNKTHIQWKNDLTKRDLLTEEEAYERVNGLFYYARKLNNHYPKINWRRAGKDVFALVCTETSFVNYASLDNGKSFGWISMQWSTAKELAEFYGWNWEEDKACMLSNERIQAKYIIGEYYRKLNTFDYKERTRYKALISYNTGYRVSDKRFEKYFFEVLGRIAYNETIWHGESVVEK